jgi:hypothetical protein
METYLAQIRYLIHISARWVGGSRRSPSGPKARRSLPWCPSSTHFVTSTNTGALIALASMIAYAAYSFHSVLGSVLWGLPLVLLVPVSDCHNEIHILALHW